MEIKKKRFVKLEKFLKKDIGLKIVLTVFFLFFLLQAIAQLFPFFWVLNNSLKGSEEYASNMSITKTWMFSNYLRVFDEFISEGSYAATYFEMLWNSVWETGLYLFVNIMASTLVAYALAKFRFPGKGFFYGLMIFTQTIPLVGSGVAAFKLKYALGLINNPYLIWTSWMMGFDYSAFILYGSFLSISNAYSESAMIDGANEFQILWKVVFPQVFPVLCALLVTNFVGKWNDFSTSQINLDKYPNLAFGLFTYQKSSQYGAKGVYYAAITMTALPGVILYAAFQNLIINNMSVGGLKG